MHYSFVIIVKFLINLEIKKEEVTNFEELDALVRDSLFDENNSMLKFKTFFRNLIDLRLSNVYMGFRKFGKKKKGSIEIN